MQTQLGKLTVTPRTLNRNPPDESAVLSRQQGANLRSIQQDSADQSRGNGSDVWVGAFGPRAAVATRLVALATSLGLGACIAPSSGGGGFAPTIAAGAVCAAEGSTSCGVAANAFATLRCTAGFWQVDTACAAGQLCGYQGATPVCRGGVAAVDVALGDASAADTAASVPDGANNPDGAAEAAAADQAAPAAETGPDGGVGAEGDAAPEVAPVADAAAPPDVQPVVDSQGGDILADTAECAVAKDCNDNDPCTSDACKNGKCQHVAVAPGSPCATGKSCTALGACACSNPKKTGPTCGECLDPAATGPECVVAGGCWPPQDWSGAVQAVSKLVVAPKFQGCDLNQDGKVDNAISSGLSALLSSVSDSLNKGVTSGSAAWLLHIPSMSSAFSLEVMPGKLAGSGGCDPQSTSGQCKYLVDAKAFDISKSTATCPPLIVYPNAKISGSTLTAGGPSQVVPISLNMQGVALSVTLHQATVSAQVALVGGKLSSTAGMNCGIVLKKDLETAIDAMPAAALQQLGMDAAALKSLISSMLLADIDSDGDGSKDAYSFAYLWEAVPAQIVGIAAP